MSARGAHTLGNREVAYGDDTATDRIEKTVILKAPRSRVWRALSDARQFGEWFQVELDGQFTPGVTIRGGSPTPATRICPWRWSSSGSSRSDCFSFRWHPGDVDPKFDYTVGADDAGRVHARGRPRRHAADHRRIGIRQDSARPARQGVPHERGRLDRADARTSSAMSRSRSAAAARLHDSAPIFAALGDETRLQIVARLCAEGPLSITRLSEGAGVTRQAITKHLNALSDAGLARSARSGREQIWELETRRLEMARRCLDQHLGPVGCRAQSIEGPRRALTPSSA